MRRPWLGIVADDFTGACDVADAVCEQGARAVVAIGVPSEPPADCDCVVVALKSRTAPSEVAVEQSRAAARWLLDSGCTTLYQKYCSTFDSTDEGNIGPVAEALADLIGGFSIGTPATPRAGRTVYQGHLFVGRKLLSESPLRHHPLNPMRDADLVRVLGRQATGAVELVTWPPDAAKIARACDGGAKHVLLDALTDEDLDTVAKALLRIEAPLLVGGGAGLAAALARLEPVAPDSRQVPTVAPGRRIILSGSCSAATLAQVAAFPGPRLDLCPLDLAADFEATVAALLSKIERIDDPVLVSSTAEPEVVAQLRSRVGPARTSALLEAATAEIAAKAVAELDFRRLIVAGGETSGAVVERLGVQALRVGPAAEPGLPWMVPASGATGGHPALLLKSGNFGGTELFTRAWETCP